MSNDFLVFAKIYEMNQAHIGCTMAALVRETALSRMTVSKSIDRLLDLGMVCCSWSSESGTYGPDIRVTDDAQGLASDIASAISRD